MTSGHQHGLCEELYNIGSIQRLDEILALNKDYKTRYPFPHMVHDGLFPPHILAAVDREIPDNPNAINGCVANSSVCYNSNKSEYRKNGFNDDSKIGPVTRGLFSFLKSSRFVNFLQELTGIPDIVPDPHYFGAGIHQTLPGGFLQIHADFNRYPRYKWYRRVNVFIFLNPNWDDSYGGHLELWDREVKDCAAMIRPSMGRLVVFSSTDFSYHGHPEPLKAPATRSRRSLALYYYSMSRPADECVEKNCESDHSTLWQTPKCGSCLDPACRKFNHII